MSTMRIEEGVRALVDDELDSFEKLEIMQALRAAGRAMSQQELAAACQLVPEVVEDTLADLERAKWVTREGGRRVRPGHRCAEPRFAVLMRLYVEDRAGVLAALSPVVVQRIRSMAARAFADAFAHKKQHNND